MTARERALAALREYGWAEERADTLFDSIEDAMDHVRRGVPDAPPLLAALCALYVEEQGGAAGSDGAAVGAEVPHKESIAEQEGYSRARGMLDTCYEPAGFLRGVMRAVREYAAEERVPVPGDERLRADRDAAYDAQNEAESWARNEAAEHGRQMAEKDADVARLRDIATSPAILVYRSGEQEPAAVVRVTGPHAAMYARRVEKFLADDLDGDTVRMG